MPRSSSLHKNNHHKACCGVCIVSSSTGTTSIVEALVVRSQQEQQEDDDDEDSTNDEESSTLSVLGGSVTTKSPRAETAIQESVENAQDIIMSNETTNTEKENLPQPKNDDDVDEKEQQQQQLAAGTGEDDEEVGNNERCTILEEEGQEALWVEDEQKTTRSEEPTTPTRRFRFKKKITSVASPKRKKQQQNHHIMLLPTGEAQQPPPNKPTPIDTSMNNNDDPPVEDPKEKYLQVASMILAARKLLDQSSFLATTGGIGNAATLKKAAFVQAVEARKLMDNNNTTEEQELVLQDAMTKGATAESHAMAKQLLEFILPAIDESYLHQAATTAAPLAAMSSVDEISTLGFDNTFDEYCKSPKEFDVLSMSSLNEILDGPVTPPTVPKEVAAVKTATQNVAAGATAVVAVATTTKKGGLFGRFGKKKAEKKAKEQENAKDVVEPPKDKKTEAKKNKKKSEVQRLTAKVLVDDVDEEMAAPDDASLRVASMDGKLRNILQEAMDNDDAMSLTSAEGVPVHEKPKKIKKKRSDKESEPEEEEVASAKKPVNFDAVKPKFVAAPRGDAAILTAKSWESLEENGEIRDDAAATSPAPPVDAVADNTGDAMYAEPVPSSSSPASSVTGEIPGDRYKVADEAAEAAVPTDKYSVLPDPCSICNSFWLSPKEETKVVEEEEEERKPEDERKLESPMMVKDLEVQDEPSVDKYTPLEDISDDVVAADTKEIVKIPFWEDNNVKKVSQKETTITKSRTRLVAGLFGKLKKNPSKDNVDKTTKTESIRKLKTSPLRKKNDKKAKKSKMIPANNKSILKEKKEASPNIEQAPVVDSKIVEAEPTKEIAGSSSNKVVAESSSDNVIAEPQDPALPSLVEDSSQSSDDNDHLVEHIKQQQHRQRRGQDPVTAEEVVANRGIDP